MAKAFGQELKSFVVSSRPNINFAFPIPSCTRDRTRKKQKTCTSDPIVLRSFHMLRLEIQGYIWEAVDVLFVQEHMGSNVSLNSMFNRRSQSL